MAIYNEILIGRLNRFLQKYLGIKGGPPAPQLAADISTNINFDDATSVELRYLTGWDRYGLNVLVAANGAGNFNEVQFRNPTGSNFVAVFEKLHIGAGVVDQPLVLHGPNVTDFASPSVATNARMDPRSRPQPALTLTFKNVGANTALGSMTIYNRYFPAAAHDIDVILDRDSQIPVFPGDTLIVQSTTANTQLGVDAYWRERALEEGELR